MEITGTIIAVCPLQSGLSKQSNKPWSSQDYVLEYRVAERYIHKFVFKLFGEDIQKNDLHVGEVVKVHYDTDAREYGERYFCANQAWKIEKLGVTNVAPQPQPAPTPQPHGNANTGSANVESTTVAPQPQKDLFNDDGKQENDLPF